MCEDMYERRYDVLRDGEVEDMAGDGIVLRFVITSHEIKVLFII